MKAMMKYYLDNIVNTLINDERLSKIEGVVRYCNRKVYIEGGEYQEYSANLIFLVDTGDWFKTTIAFSIITNSFSCDIKVVKHVSGENQTFNRKPAKKVAVYIINNVIKFQNKDKDYINVINM